MRTSIIILSLVALVDLALNAEAAVMGIDYGTRWTKVAIVKAGKLNVVLNEQAKRKTPSAVGFVHDDERVVGNDALIMAVKKPHRVFQDMKWALGVPFNNHSLAYFLDHHAPYRIEPDDTRGTLQFRHTELVSYSAEELVAMQLAHIRHLAELDMGSTVKECVITVPSFFSQAQRRALQDAASLAGLRVLGLLSSTASAALNYGMDRKFDAEKPEFQIILDYGAGSLTASLVKFLPLVEKGGKKPSSLRARAAPPGELTILATASDDSMGGAALDVMLANHLATLVAEQVHVSLETVLANARTMAKLMHAAERAKIVLSANAENHVAIESVYEDHDLFTQVTRAEFLELIEPLLSRVVPVIRQVLHEGKIDQSDVQHVLLVGASTRIPRLQELVADMFGGSHILGHKLNADEAGALGAVFYAAGMSAAHRVREFKVRDAVAHAIQVKLTDGPKTILFPKNCAFPSTKLLTFPRDTAVSMKLGYLDSALLPRLLQSPMADDFSAADLDILGLRVEGIQSLVDLQGYNGTLTLPPKLSLSFRMDASGIVGLDRSEVVVEEQLTVREEVPSNDTKTSDAKKKKKTKKSDADADAEETAADQERAEEQLIEQLMDDDDSLTFEAAENLAQEQLKVQGSEAVDEPAPEPVFRDVVQQRTHRLSLPLQSTSADPAIIGSSSVQTEVYGIQPMSDSARSASEAVLKGLDEAARQRHLTAEAKNTLESYVYSMRDKLELTEEVPMMSTEEEREGCLAGYAETVEWLYEDGEDANADQYKQKLGEMRKLGGDAILERVQEYRDRPDALNATALALNVTRTFLDIWARDELSAVSESERNVLQAQADALEAYVEEKAAEQDKLPLTADPVLKASLIMRRVVSLEREVEIIARRPRKKPTPTPTPIPTPTQPMSTPKVEGNDTGSDAGGDTVDAETDAVPGDVPPVDDTADLGGADIDADAEVVVPPDSDADRVRHDDETTTSASDDQ